MSPLEGEIWFRAYLGREGKAPGTFCLSGGNRIGMRPTFHNKEATSMAKVHQNTTDCKPCEVRL